MVVVIPFIGMFVLAEFKGSLGDVRYLSTTVPVLLLLLARGVTTLATGRRLFAVVLGALVGVLVIALVDQQFSAQIPVGSTSGRPSSGWTPRPDRGTGSSSIRSTSS